MGVLEDLVMVTHEEEGRYPELDETGTGCLETRVLDHENTVYHVGYPESFRQIGTVPNMQFSLSEDGTKADIDVDYRSSHVLDAGVDVLLRVVNVGDDGRR